VYGKHGFTRPQKIIVSTNTINVCELDSRVPELLRAGFAEEKDGAVHIDVNILGIDKVLGTGRVNRALAVSAPAFSANAVTKIENAGGTVIHI
jgi:large subunit ribosomal protein L15